MKTIMTCVLAIALANPMEAQPDCAGCDEMHGQFDFWVGERIVSDTLGNKSGDNSISKIDDHCILSEHWTGAKGGLQSGRMVLKSDMIKGTLKEWHYNQITWSHAVKYWGNSKLRSLPTGLTRQEVPPLAKMIRSK